MSRTERAKPSSGCWMREPHHVRAERQLEASASDMHIEGLAARPRKAIPPSDYDDLIVSYWRGQAWARRARA